MSNGWLGSLNGRYTVNQLISCGDGVDLDELVVND